MTKRNPKAKEFRNDLPIHIILLLIASITFYPFIFMIITSFKDNAQFMHHFFGVTYPLHFSNYQDAWSQISGYILNSIIVTSGSVLGVLILSSAVAYIFARFDFPGRDFFFLAIISLLMIPGILTLVPAFLVVKRLNLLDTRWALLLPYISGGQVFAIFVLRSFFSSIPEELLEAARIDGADEFQCFFKVVMPLSGAILTTVAIMNVLWTWNDYVWPLVTLADDSLWTITLGLVGFQSQYAGMELWGPLFAGYVIASIPLIMLFFFTMRYFVAGLTSGALKI